MDRLKLVRPNVLKSTFLAASSTPLQQVHLPEIHSIFIQLYNKYTDWPYQLFHVCHSDVKRSHI